MSRVCGWYGYASGIDDAGDALRRMAAHSGISRECLRHEIGPNFAIGIDGGRGDGAVVRSDSLVVCVVGSPSTGSGAKSDGLERIAVEFASRWRTDSSGCIRELRGGFALVVIELDRGRVTLAVDRVGGRYPLCFSSRNGAAVFATHSGAVARHPAVDAPTDPQAVFNYLYFHVVPAPRTGWLGVERLEPGCRVSACGSQVTRRSPEPPRFVEAAPATLEMMEDRFRAAIRDGVARLAVPGTTGCYLSGGTDSSTVVGMLASLQDEPVRCYSIGFDADGYDEMEYARIAARRFGAKHTEYYLAANEVVDGVERIARTFTEPFGNASALPAYYCARIAREDGVQRMLAGDGGDELFGGNERYRKQDVFRWYERLPGSLRRGVLEPLALGSEVGNGLGIVRKARTYVRKARTPLPDRLQWFNLLERSDLREMLEPEFVAAIDVEEPRRHLREIYGAPPGASELNRMLALDWVLTLADNDLPKVSRTAELAGVEVAYPFLDDAVIDLSMVVPSGWKIRRGQLRWFFKHALREFLPAEILVKEKHGFGLPFGVWMRDHARLQELAYDSLGSLGRRRILQPRFLDRLVDQHRGEHPGFYGAFVWVFMMLEQWYRIHVPSEGGT